MAASRWNEALDNYISSVECKEAAIDLRAYLGAAREAFNNAQHGIAHVQLRAALAILVYHGKETTQEIVKTLVDRNTKTAPEPIETLVAGPLVNGNWTNPDLLFELWKKLDYGQRTRMVQICYGVTADEDRDSSADWVDNLVMNASFTEFYDALLPRQRATYRSAVFSILKVPDPSHAEDYSSSSD
tara:strand:+ start:601 stop:1158 length:558 start_codon:yes stop_codon:yes gene_type:complete